MHLYRQEFLAIVVGIVCLSVVCWPFSLARAHLRNRLHIPSHKALACIVQDHQRFAILASPDRIC